MNFALMFALALGIDYALFVVYPLPRRVLRLERSPPRRRSAETMDTAGKAVLFSGLTVLISLSAVMLVPEPGVPLDEPRDHALGHLRARGDADAAAGRAGQARAARRRARRCRGCTPASTARRASPPGASGCGAARCLRRGRAGRPRRAAAAGARPGDRHAVDQGRAAGDGSRVRATSRCSRRSAPAPPGRCSSSRAQATPRRVAAIARADPGDRAGHARRSRGRTAPRWSRRSPKADPSVEGRRRDGRPAARGAARRATLVGGAVAENHDLESVAVGQDAAGHRRRPRARLPAAARRAAGADHRRRRRAHEPAGHRRGVRRREADLPGRPPVRACSASSRRASSTPGARCSSSR